MLLWTRFIHIKAAISDVGVYLMYVFRSVTHKRRRMRVQAAGTQTEGETKTHLSYSDD